MNCPRRHMLCEKNIPFDIKAWLGKESVRLDEKERVKLSKNAKIKW